MVRQPFAVCFHARPLSGSPGGDQVETSDARWFTAGDIGALPIRPAMRLRIGHAFAPAAPATSADITEVLGRLDNVVREAPHQDAQLRRRCDALVQWRARLVAAM